MIELLIAVTASLLFGGLMWFAFELHIKNVIYHERRDCAERWREYYAGVEVSNDEYS